MRTDKEKAARLGRIGSTDIAALTGHSTFRKPIDVYRSCVDGWESDPTDQAIIGTLLEDDVLELYSLKTGRKISKVGTILHPGNDFTVDTPDAVSWLDDEIDERAVEAKTCVGWKYDQWGERGTDEVPESYLIQGQYHLLHLRALEPYRHISKCDIPVLIGGCTFAVYTVAWNENLAGSLMEIAAKFHRDHIAPRRPPPVDDSPAYVTFLRDTFPLHRGELKPADAEIVEAARVLRMARHAKREAEAWQRKCENEIKAKLGNGAGFYSSEFKLSWLTQRDGKRVFRFKDFGESDNE